MGEKSKNSVKTLYVNSHAHVSTKLGSDIRNIPSRPNLYLYSYLQINIKHQH